jgi:hypothetical protein
MVKKMIGINKIFQQNLTNPARFSSTSEWFELKKGKDPSNKTDLF